MKTSYTDLSALLRLQRVNPSLTAGAIASAAEAAIVPGTNTAQFTLAGRQFKVCAPSGYGNYGVYLVDAGNASALQRLMLLAIDPLPTGPRRSRMPRDRGPRRTY